jgi:hypothetical protein
MPFIKGFSFSFGSVSSKPWLNDFESEVVMIMVPCAAASYVRLSVGDFSAGISSGLVFPKAFTRIFHSSLESLRFDTTGPLLVLKFSLTETRLSLVMMICSREVLVAELYSIRVMPRCATQLSRDKKNTNRQMKNRCKLRMMIYKGPTDSETCSPSATPTNSAVSRM